MLINDVCEKTGLTKKAISYYGAHGLVSPKKKSNGYREYYKVDVDLLNEISLYRRLDIPIKDIKSIINSKDKRTVLNKVLEDKHKREIEIKIQRMYLERIMEGNFSEEDVSSLNEEIKAFENQQSMFIKKELSIAFPSGLGRYLAYHFSPYLNEPLDNTEKYKAYLKIVEFLDNVPDIKIPRIIEIGYKIMNYEMQEKIHNNSMKEINKMINASGEELEEYKKKILLTVQEQNEKFILKMLNPFNNFKKQLNDFFNCSGYYDVFIPNMKIISNSYREYHDKLTRLNDKVCKELGIRYDENMRIVIDKK